MSRANLPNESKRPTCTECRFPLRTCVCDALPTTPLASYFHRCRIVVLQHPHELKRKNGSIPLLQFCLFGTSSECDSKYSSNEDFVMKIIVGRRFANDCDAAVTKILHDPNEVKVLVFPHSEAVDMNQGIHMAEQQTKAEISDATCKKITLIFIDATWKHAREMDDKITKWGEWPVNLIRVQLIPTLQSDSLDRCCKQISSENHTTDGDFVQTQFIQRRFQIRAPPSPDHLSTAECIAWMASHVERNCIIFENVTKVLDRMVQLWRVNVECGGGDNDWGSMSQKPMEIRSSRD